MTTEITIIYKDKELMLELECHKAEPMTRHYPGHDAEFEIISAKSPDGELINDDEIEFIDKNEADQIWDKLERLDDYTREDYLLEKHEDDALENGRNWPWRF